MFELSWQSIALALAVLGPATLVSLKYILRQVMHLQGKVVVITGASSGLGKACALKFYCYGCQVILCSRNMEKLEEVKSELIHMKIFKNPNIPVIVQLDISNKDSIVRAIENIKEKFPNGVHILVNNAGISYRGEILSTEMDVHRKVMETNYFGQILFTRSLLPSMLKVSSEGRSIKAHIVLINSIQGLISIPHRSAYSASKFACTAFFDCLKSELAESGVQICSVYPSYIKTNLSLNAVKSDGSNYGKVDKNTQYGMSPAYVASRIIDAVVYNKDEIILSSVTARVAVWLRFFATFLYFWIMKRRARKKEA